MACLDYGDQFSIRTRLEEQQLMEYLAVLLRLAMTGRSEEIVTQTQGCAVNRS